MSDRDIMEAKNYNNDPKKDKYVQAVKEKFEQRSQTGIKKYNTTLEREDLDIIDWLRHAQEEAMDLTLYLEKIIAEIGDKLRKG
jgi:succinate dehydrogenase flavin-adding protein (antitoxin of CptAB toxin-antitoxin module)